MAKILVADDSRFQVQLLSSYLSAGGHQVITALDAMQASMIALRELPDAVVLDINMPGGTGFAVLKRLKTSTKTCHIPVVIVSGNEMEPGHVREIGATRFLHKPVEAVVFRETINQIVTVRR